VEQMPGQQRAAPLIAFGQAGGLFGEDQPRTVQVAVIGGRASTTRGSTA
jgi:hypothetical protein